MQHVSVEMQQHIMTSSLKNALSAAYPHYQLKEEGEKNNRFWVDINIWKRAGTNTFTCLIGCSIGDFAMIIFLQSYYHHINMFLMMGLAMATGLVTSVILETILLKINEKFNLFLALKLSLIHI